MDTKETIANVGSAVLEEPIRLEVTINAQSRLHEKMQKLLPRYFPKKKIISIHPICMGSLVKISKLLLSIDKNVFDKDNLMDSNYAALEKHTDTMAKVIAIAVHNKKSDPPKTLVDLVIDQFTPKELMSTISIVLRQMDISNFMSSIISVRSGLSILEKQTASVTTASEKEVSQ